MTSALPCISFLWYPKAIANLGFVHWAVTATVAHDVLKELFVGDVVKFVGVP